MNKRYIIITALIIMVLTGCSKSSYIIKNGSIEKEKNKISGFMITLMDIRNITST